MRDMASTRHLRLVLLVAALCGAAAAAPECMYDPRETLQKKGMEAGIRVGVAVTAKSLLDDRYRTVVRREFNTIVAERDMKLEAIYRPSRTPGQGSFDFTKADRIAKFAKDNGMKLRFHTLLWHKSIPPRIRDWRMNRQQWRSWITRYIEAVVRRYKDDVWEWDVVNEAIVHSKIDFERPDGIMRRSFWLERLGDDYIELCFRAAARAAPNAMLCYNEYAIEWENPKTDIVFKKLTSMRNAGVPVHCIGFQGHISFWEGNEGKYRRNFRRWKQAGFSMSLTEMDVFQDCRRAADYFDRQARLYKRFVNFAIEAGFRSVLVWGVHDKQSWVNLHPGMFPCKRDPLLYDDNMREKKSYFFFKDALCENARRGGGGGGGGGGRGGGGGGRGGGGRGDRDVLSIWPRRFTTKQGGGPSPRKGWILKRNGDYIRTRFRCSGHNRLIVLSRQIGGGPGTARVRVYVDSRQVTAMDVRRDTTWTIFTFNRRLHGEKIVKIEFAGDFWQSRPRIDRNLEVEKVMFKKV